MSASKAISSLKPIFDKYNPAFPFEYQFADDNTPKNLITKNWWETWQRS
jgi:hypothetical protein